MKEDVLQENLQGYTFPLQCTKWRDYIKKKENQYEENLSFQKGYSDEKSGRERLKRGEANVQCTV